MHRTSGTIDGMGTYRDHMEIYGDIEGHMWTYKDIHSLEVILELLRFPESVQYFLPRDCTLNQVRDPSVM